MIRLKIWAFLCRNQPEGRQLPTWLLIIKAVLWPLRYITYSTYRGYGYAWYSDTWRINGVVYSGYIFESLRRPGTKLEVVSLDNDVVTVRDLRNVLDK